ncbi:unnamed protein product [Withania somnifera]
MGEKKSKGGEEKKGENNKEEGNLTLVLKSDFHCEGCVTKVVKAIRSMEGVEKVMCDVELKKVRVIGKVDPVMLREKVEEKTHKHVEVISPVPKKGGDSGAGEDKKNKGNDNNTKQKERPITTVVLKVHLHCQGCIQKIYKIVTKFKGYKEMKVDKQKDLVTVTGSMDMKELAEMLKKHLKKEVEIVPPKKEAGEKKEKGGGGSDNGKGKEKMKMKMKDELDVGGGGEMMRMGSNIGNGLQMMHQQVQFGYLYPYMYGPVGSVYPTDPYPVSIHAPQLFSDENPNACSIM